jgi:NAD(P)-dependent dehydrogenase (short-subunit alcohol dehydrogenase family)
MTTEPASRRPLCLVTGANAGIGYEAALGLARLGARVVLGCRNAEKGEEARRAIIAATQNPDIELLIIDLASQRSIRTAGRAFTESHPELDVLVNNAGVVLPRREVSPDGIEMTWATNVLGYFLMTEMVFESLKNAPAARVINVSSMMSYGLDLDDVEFKRRRYEGAEAYAASKQADRMLTWGLAQRVEGTSVTANAMHPGPVNTRLLATLSGRGGYGQTPAQGADTIIWLAAAPQLAGINGGFWGQRREQGCPYRDPEAVEALWSLCERMTPLE